MSKFQGKTALVIGGSRGIGAAIVTRLAKEGAAVRFTYAGSRDAADTLAGATGATAIRSDASKRDELVSMVAAQGAIDILVVSAGVFNGGHVLEIEPDAVDHGIDVNVRAPWHAAATAAKTMPDGGRIIVIGSVNGDRMPFPGGAAYAMTKSAVQGMVRGLARDLGDRGITVNAVQPGPVDTDMNPADGPMKDVMHGFMAIKRHIRPDEIAGLVSYLASEEAAMVTGAMHTIDGGFGA